MLKSGKIFELNCGFYLYDNYFPVPGKARESKAFEKRTKFIYLQNIETMPSWHKVLCGGKIWFLFSDKSDFSFYFREVGCNDVITVDLVYSWSV